MAISIILPAIFTLEVGRTYRLVLVGFGEQNSEQRLQVDTVVKLTEIIEKDSMMAGVLIGGGEVCFHSSAISQAEQVDMDSAFIVVDREGPLDAPI
jgi:hypothetical protein